MLLVRPHDNVAVRVDIEEPGSPPFDVVEGARRVDGPAGRPMIRRRCAFYDVCRHGPNYSERAGTCSSITEKESLQTTPRRVGCTAHVDADGSASLSRTRC